MIPIIYENDEIIIINKAAGLATVMCEEFLNTTEEAIITPIIQDEKEATYQKAISIKDSILDMNQPTNLIIKRICI